MNASADRFRKQRIRHQGKNKKYARCHGKPCKPLSAGRSSDKKTIECLIFPEKVEFDGKSFQTPKMNIVAQCIYQYNNGLGNKKNRHKRVKTSNVGLVTSTGFKPVTF